MGACVADEPVPEVVVSVLGAASVRAPAGGAATLACQARYEPPPQQLPLPDLDIRWQKGNLPISLQVRIDYRVSTRASSARRAEYRAGVCTGLLIIVWCRAGAAWRWTRRGGRRAWSRG